jgi:hypothetical protein
MPFTRIACIADDTPKAQAALKEIKKHYELSPLTKRNR